MQRITITLDDPLNDAFEAFRARRGYGNRSEAIRDLIRERLDGERLERQADGDCVGYLTYVFDHRTRELASRLTQAQHDHHDLAVATLHVHLDHDHCLETVILRGAATRVRAFADRVIAQPGVRHGHLGLLPVTVSELAHEHGDAGGTRRHVHIEPNR